MVGLAAKVTLALAPRQSDSQPALRIERARPIDVHGSFYRSSLSSGIGRFHPRVTNQRRGPDYRLASGMT